jgi:thiamine pyrophosphate-dependent acetolactate synthase large subunit-like protein
MGMCIPFALGLSLAFPRRKVVAIESDGSLLLDASSLITLAEVNPPNLLVLVFDNESFGPRMGPTATARHADLAVIAKGAGIENVETISELGEFDALTIRALGEDKLSFLVIKVELGRESVEFDPRRTHGRPMKELFVEAVRKYPDYGRPKAP